MDYEAKSKEELIAEIENLKQEVNKREHIYQYTINHMFIGIGLHEVVLDENGNPIDFKYIEINNAFAKLTNFTKDITGKTFTEVFDPERAKLLIDLFTEVFLTGNEVVNSFFPQENIFLEVTVYKISDAMLIGELKDVTKYINKKKQLKESEDRYRFIAEHSSDVIWTRNRNLQFTYISPSIKKLIGYTPEEVMNSKIEDRLPPESIALMMQTYAREMERERKGMNKGLKHRIVGLEMQEKHKAGHLVWVEMVLTMILNEEGHIKEIIGVTRDITERKKSEAKLKKSLQKSETADKLKSAFLANMSHEIRTPLNAIIGFVDLILMENKLDDIYIKYLNSIKYSGKQLLNLINDILDLSKIEAGQIEIYNRPCSVFSIIKNVELQTRAIIKKFEKPIELRINDSDAMDLNIISDAMRIEQIISNLTSNAIKYTDTGYIEIGVENKSDGMLTFYVEDTGTGIPDDKFDIIFNPFIQLDEWTNPKHKGAGLGLTIVKRLIDLMDGEIEVESSINNGSKFTFTIPVKLISKLDHKTFSYQQKSVDKVKKIDSGHTVLLVEDNETNIDVVSQMLAENSIEVIVAHNGLEALEIFDSKADSIDLIIMDMRMPKMNGFLATEKIRRIEKDTGRDKIPIIALTAAAMQEDIEKGFDAGCDSYLIKPVEYMGFISEISKYLN